MTNLTNRVIFLSGGLPMAKPVNLYEAKTQLSRLVDRAAAGEEIIIAKAGRPMARLVALEEHAPKRTPGRWRGKIWIAPNFDDPMTEEELKEWYEGDIEPRQE